MGGTARLLPTFLPRMACGVILATVVKFLSWLHFDPVAQLVEQRTFNP